MAVRQATGRAGRGRPVAAEVALLTEGGQALAARLALIDGARRSVLAQYYSWQEDVSGRLLLAALLRAARRGVSVRLLIDDLHAGEHRYLESLTADTRIQLRMFNPFWLRFGRRYFGWLEILYSFRRLNHRMHNKLLLVDGEWAILGGRNIGDAYFDLDPQRHFIDVDVLCRGAICPILARGFLFYWRSRWSHHWRRLHWLRPAERQLQQLQAQLLQCGLPEMATRQALPAFELAALAWYPARARLLLDPPRKILHLGRRPRHAVQALLAEFWRLQHSLTVVSPYLVLTRALYRALRRLSRQQRRLIVLTNSLASTDVPATYAGYRRRRRHLLRFRAALHELQPHAGDSLHAKLALLDEHSLLIGSLNLDPRSFYLNTEMALLLESPALVAALQPWLTRLLSPDASWQLQADGVGVRWPTGRVEPQTRWWQRLWIRLLAYLPLRHLL